MITGGFAKGIPSNLHFLTESYKDRYQSNKRKTLKHQAKVSLTSSAVQVR